MRKSFRYIPNLVKNSTWLEEDLITSDIYSIECNNFTPIIATEVLDSAGYSTTFKKTPICFEGYIEDSLVDVLVIFAFDINSALAECLSRCSDTVKFKRCVQTDYIPIIIE